MCRPNERAHKHHIVPRYMGGSDTPENLVEVTVTQHAMFHFCNYQLWGNEEDRIAWRALSGQITPDEIALEAIVLGGRKGGNKIKETKTGIFRRSPEQMSEDSKKGGKIGGNKIKENKIGICGLSLEELSEAGKKGGKISTSQKWQCTETRYVSTAGGLTCYQNKRGIDTSKRIKVDGPRSWEITFEDGIVVVITKTLKDWAEENDYIYNCLIKVRGGEIKNHKGIIKVVCF
jgi:hypothetical protein